MNREEWIESAEALLALDAKNALVPHGIGGHARTLLQGAIELLRAANSDGGVEPKPVAWTRDGSLSILKDHWPMVEVIDASFEETPTFNTPLFLHPPAKALDGIAVKALEWTKDGHAWIAVMFWGLRYRIHETPAGKFILRDPLNGPEFFDTLPEAKAAAQADRDQRIRSALTIPK